MLGGWRRLSMTKVDQLKVEIESLPSEQIAEIYRWLADKEWEKWDKEIERDSRGGKLDFLAREAREGKRKGKLKAL